MYKRQIVYGRTGSDIAREYKIPKHQGQGWIDWWFNTFKEAHSFLLECREMPIKEWSIVSPFGNRKRPKVITHKTKHNIQNQASNFLPQNIASNLILDATAILVERHMKNWSLAHQGWEIVNLIHDETLFQIDDDESVQIALFNEFAQLIEELAWEHNLTEVPFICEAKVGTHWGSMIEQTWQFKLQHTYGE